MNKSKSNSKSKEKNSSSNKVIETKEKPQEITNNITKEGPPPKKAKTAFFHYMDDIHDSLKNKGIKGKNFSIEAGKMWQDFDSKAKEKYQSLFEKDKERHAKELKDYEEKGYYISVDGNKIVRPKDIPETSIGNKDGDGSAKPKRKSSSKSKKKKKKSNDDDDDEDDD